MNRQILRFGLALSIAFWMHAGVWAQHCPNLDFSTGTLQNWQCYMGGCSAGSYWVSPTAPIPGKIDIMDRNNLEQLGLLYDPYCNVIKKVPDGYNFSCRIGNANGNAEVDGVEYTMTVDSSNSLLLLSYAWVQQYANGHTANELPKFLMRITDTAGHPIMSLPCHSYSSDSGMQNLACAGNINAQDWTTTGFDLSALIGQTIKVYFETRDCTQGGHFGYAYVVVECRPMQIELAYCEGSTAGRMIAPGGFVSYEWTRSKVPNWIAYTRQINVPSPIDGEIFTCKMTNNLGCTTQLQAVFQKTSINAHFRFGVKGQHGNPNDVCLPCNNFVSWYDTCSRTATFVDMSTITNSKKDKITWTIHGLNARSVDSMWTFTFPDPDTPTTYLVRLQVEAENQCADTSHSIDHFITIYPSAKVRIDGPTELCDGDEKHLTPQALHSYFIAHYWSWRKNNGSTGAYTGDSLLITGPGTYYLMSKDTNDCYAYDTFMVTSLKPIIQNLQIRHVKCHGDATGQFLHGDITGGQPPFQDAVWTFWDKNINGYRDSNVIALLGTTIVFREQVAGDYHFFAIDNQGCEVRATLTITQPDPLLLSAISEKADCLGNDGTITVVGKGGVPPYTISVNGAAAQQQSNVNENDTVTFANLPAGSYTATVTDANGCSTFDTVNITAIGAPVITGKVLINGTSPHSGVTVTMLNLDDSTTISTTTGTLGEYTFTVPCNANVSITPDVSGYFLTPLYITLSNVTTDISKQNFTTIEPNISGIVYRQNQTSLNSGKVYLYAKQNNGQYTLKSTASINYGNYRFTGVEDGDYLIKAIPPISEHALPTYYGNTALWQKAIIVKFEESVWTPYSNNITLISLPPLNGNSVINGYVGKGKGYKSISQKAVDKPAEDVDVYLQTELGSDWETIACDLTDANGYFEFTKVPAGKYRVVLDVPGLEIDEPIIVEILKDGDTIKNIEYELTEDGINNKTGVTNYELRIANYVIYPNPTTGQLRITNYELREGTVIEIYDVYGKKHISHFTIHDSHFTIDISHLANGLYFLKVDNKMFKIIKE